MDSKMYEKAVTATRNKVKIHNLINFDVEPIEPVKVSVVVPVCNVETYLRECLDSAVNQTLKEIEIICVNDGSTDGSLAILMEYAAKDRRVKIIDKDNAGYGHAMNIGMDMASGQYIGILESDDFADLHMYEDLYAIAEANQVDFIKADFNRFVVENGKFICTYNNVAKRKEFYNRVIDPAEETFTFRFIMNTWSGIYSRDFLVSNFIRHQETPGASYQDNGFWFQTMINASRIYVVDKPYYMNRRDNPNSSVYNRAKVYCVNQEYKFIYEMLKSDEAKYGKFLGEFRLKQYHNYMFSYRRIANEFKLEYIQAISAEFKEAVDLGEVDEELFEDYEWEEYEWIIQDPAGYFDQNNDLSIRVSVIIPVFNGEQHLKQCLDSVLNQSLKEIEVICVDDGSEDNSLKILQEYALQDSRLTYLTQDHKGGGAARNKGMSVAKGAYLSFLDCDDFFELCMLEHAYNKCKNNNADICIYKVKRYDNNSGKVISDAGSFVESNMLKRTVFPPIEMGSKIFNTFQTWPWNKMFRRRFVEKEHLLFQEILRTNDMYFVNTALLRAKRVTTLKEELVFYRVGTKDNCQATNNIAPLDFFEALRGLYQEVLATGTDRTLISFQNLLVRSCWYNLQSLLILDGEAYEKLYCFLHEEGLKSVDFASIDHSKISKDNLSAYKECKKIYEVSFAGYMTDKLKWYRNTLDNRNEEVKKLKKEVTMLKSPQNQATGNAILTLLNYENRLRKVENISACLEHAEKARDFERQLILIRASATYRIGRTITFIPRLLRHVFTKAPM